MNGKDIHNFVYQIGSRPQAPVTRQELSNAFTLFVENFGGGGDDPNTPGVVDLKADTIDPTSDNGRVTVGENGVVFAPNGVVQEVASVTLDDGGALFLNKESPNNQYLWYDGPNTAVELAGDLPNDDVTLRSGASGNVLFKTSTTVRGDINASGFQLFGAGARIDKFSTDGTMAGNSNTAVPTEAAVVTYVAAQLATSDSWAESLAVSPNSGANSPIIDAGQTLSVDKIDQTTTGGAQIAMTSADSIFMTTDGGNGVESYFYAYTTGVEMVSISGGLIYSQVAGDNNAELKLKVNAVNSAHIRAFDNTLATASNSAGDRGAMFVGTNGGSIVAGVTNTLVASGLNITAKTDDTLYANQISLQPAGNTFDAILAPPVTTGDRTYTFPDDSGTVALTSNLVTIGSSGEIPYVNAGGNDLSYSSTFVFSATGNLGLGIDSPTVPLHVKNATTNLANFYNPTSTVGGQASIGLCLNDSLGNETKYAGIVAQIANNGDTTEEGEFRIAVMTGGAVAEKVTVTGTEFRFDSGGFGFGFDGGTLITAIHDTDTMTEDSPNALATQQSIKAYVDTQLATKDSLSEVLTTSNITSGNNVVFTKGDRILSDTGSGAIDMAEGIDNGVTITADNGGYTDGWFYVTPSIASIGFGDFTADTFASAEFTDKKVRLLVNGAGSNSATAFEATNNAAGNDMRIGFYGAIPVAKPAAITQDYATTSSIHSSRTAANMTDNSGGGPTDGTIGAITTGGNVGADIPDAIAELAAMINKLIADQANSAQVLNQVIDDLQSQGLRA